ncbi:ATP-binding protein [Jongsikchunia kroppenstedtii]|uniref:ATP-binding protein n=1 Tax=Jongsikchunia kroppenstedtii TaxID=1121721 RepID=UPI00037D885C|nr:ATP-binding protein [Jongsikchunia kroppenstedtii]
MTSSPPRASASPARIVRRDGGRVIGGVCGGIADHFGVQPLKVRVVFVGLAAMAGAGAAAYALLWFMCPQGDDTDPPAAGERRQGIGLALLGAAAMFVVAFLASGTPAGYLVPLVVVAIGAMLVWREVDNSTTGAGRTRPRALTWVRLAGGSVLVVAGLVVAVLAGAKNIGGLATSVLAVLATLLGVGLLTVPIWIRMLRTINAERSARIRNEEREEIASHLHDSVLQTLALIQKQSNRPEEVARLARSQERELRRWLFGGNQDPGSSLAAALATIAAEVEDGYGIEVDVITVGDLAFDPEPKKVECWSALLGATREAMVNAAKHSGERKVSVYAEVTDLEVEVFIRDRGKGFDMDAVPDDRQGVAKSILTRVDRRGGSAEVQSTPGRGTEVRLTMPRETARETEIGSRETVVTENGTAENGTAETGVPGSGMEQESND